ncbi:hypothetical protein D8I35_06970 [Corticibacter populi]|uniref:Uncharacterized protein n=2 Tax=Corticibacter populi TaxID=1550736 RepID=A0A3M6R0J2_9BURK|nr:hypothetical protein D8I35_06970 [Corticibacter populi]
MLAALGALLLTGCASRAPTPDWQSQAGTALQHAQAAYFDGRGPVHALELALARQQLARTASPQELARLELRQCALQAASLDWQPCTAFEPLRGAAEAPERAYAAYLDGTRLSAAEQALLPASQRAAAGLHQLDAASLATVASINEPLSRLLAAALLYRRSGALSPELLQTAVDTASQQGWRRPLLAWLLRQQSYAQEHQLSALQESTRLRIAIIEGQGELP